MKLNQFQGQADSFQLQVGKCSMLCAQVSSVFAHTQFPFGIANKANNEMSLGHTHSHPHTLNTILIISLGDVVWGKMSESVCVCECKYNHADIVYARDYAAYAKSHHSCTPTHTHTRSRHAWFLPRAQKYRILCGVARQTGARPNTKALHNAPAAGEGRLIKRRRRRRRHFSLKPTNWWDPLRMHWAYAAPDQPGPSPIRSEYSDPWDRPRGKC